MNEIMDGYQDGLKMFDDIKEKKEEMEGMTNEVTDSDGGMKGIVGLVDGNKDSNGIMGLAKGTNAADNSSDSPERASDDTYSIGSFFSDLQSFGGDAAEMLEESKKFFTKLGAVVAIIGTCISTGGSLANAIRDKEVKTAVFAGILLLGIQIPTTLAMLFVFLKEWVKATITGFLKAKEELEELASDLESFVDDTEKDENMKDLEASSSNAKEKAVVETDELRRDLEKTKMKNNYNSVEELDKCDIIEFPSALEKKTGAKQTTDWGFVSVNDLCRNGDPAKSLEQSIRNMEEGVKVSEKPDTFPGTDKKRQLPKTPSVNRDRRIHGESPRTSSRPVRTSSGSVRKTSRSLINSSKPIVKGDTSAAKAHRDAPSKARNGPHRSSTRVGTSQRQRPDILTRSEVTSPKSSDSQKERPGNSSFKRNDSANDRRPYGEKRLSSGKETAANVHRSKSPNSKKFRRSTSERTPKTQKKKLDQATQTVQEHPCIESKADFAKNGAEKMRENGNGVSRDDKEIRVTANCWKLLWNRGSKK